LLIAARAHGFSRQPQDVTRILRVCGMTVTTRVKEFELTHSARLTLDQFNRVELETEADPPIFTRNRIMEARAKAIQDNNVALLESGALDNPLESKKHAVKWRNGKPKKKDQEFEKLYRTIERDLSNVAEEDSKDYEDDGVVKEKEESSVASTGGDDAAGDAPDEEYTIKSESFQQPLSILKNTSGKWPSGMEISKSVTIANGQLTQIPKNWEKAYPRTHRGKAIILHDQAIAEELQPSTIPSEGILDTKTWQLSMPQEMVEDFDSIFRDPAEIAQKEAIFNKINKDYIDLQAQKDKIRVSTEEAENQDEQDLVEQAQGHERYRKRKNRGRDTAETTEEALMQAVANRKISRKINYDAMSAIFDDAGSFSTAEAGGAVPGIDEEVQMPDF
jgi:transcription factor IIIB subunit 2